MHHIEKFAVIAGEKRKLARLYEKINHLLKRPETLSDDEKETFLLLTNSAKKEALIAKENFQKALSPVITSAASMLEFNNFLSQRGYHPDPNMGEFKLYQIICGSITEMLFASDLFLEMKTLEVGLNDGGSIQLSSSFFMKVNHILELLGIQLLMEIRNGNSILVVVQLTSVAA